MPNGDLISRKALLEIYKNWLPQLTKPEDAGDRNGVETCIAVLEDAPAVDAEPVRYGKMNVHTVWHMVGLGEIFTKFECCGFEERGTKKYKFCPNCGARMAVDHE